MLRDPLYRQIRERLSDLSDGKTFELCANDLLSRIHPSLAPREGGNDAGLDGATSDAIQLICTTGSEVLRNLKNSIDSNLKSGGTYRACILATSQKLSNKSKRDLESEASKRGRTLIQIYDQAGMAQLLYRDPRWLKELLGLTGDPPPLSIFPLTNRPLLDQPPIGRDEDMDRILESTGDSLVVGQPGSGKTHLLYTIAKQVRGRFVVHEDIALIANGLRNLKPRFLIVDDAHSRIDLLKRLKHLRNEIGANFYIIASCWPNQEDEIASVLQIPKQRCFEIEPLLPKQIKEVIHSQKIAGPPHLLSELIHQAHGKPGLAITLCRICWESGTREVVLGTALAQDIKFSLGQVMGNDAIELLAYCSMGGDAGMNLAAVARLSGKTALQTKRVAEQISAAGTLEISHESNVTVHPMRLRQALVRDIILKPPAVDLAPILAEAPDSAATTRVLIEAKALGGAVSPRLLMERLEMLRQSYDTTAFSEYCQLGRSEAEWFLDHFPERLPAVAAHALAVAPEKTVPLLLDAAHKLSLEWQAPPFGNLLPEIGSWILGSTGDQTFETRRILASIVEKWSACRNDQFVSVCAAGLALSIKHESTSIPPGESMVVSLKRGVVAQPLLSRIASLAPILIPILKNAHPSCGAYIADILHPWIHPDFDAPKIPKDYILESRAHAKNILSELLKVFSGDWTFQHHFRRYAEVLGLGDQLRLDPTAEVLFPSRELGDWRQADERNEYAAEELAKEWSTRSPKPVVQQLVTIAKQAELAGISGRLWDRHVCREIAARIQNPEPWLTELFSAGAHGMHVEPFLESLLIANRQAAEPFLFRGLEVLTLRGICVSLTIKYFEADSLLWNTANQYLVECIGMVETLILRNEVPLATIRILLRSSEPIVASHAAVALWRENSKPRVSIELLDDWKRVIVEYVDEGHILENIFKEFPDLAFPWIARRFEDIRTQSRSFWFGHKHDRALPAAVSEIPLDKRAELIDMLPNQCTSRVVRMLVGNHAELFQRLLSKEGLSYLKLTPLETSYDDSSGLLEEFSESWMRMAAIALENGHSEEAVFEASQGGGGSWSGLESNMYANRLLPFEKLLQHADPRLRRIGEIGVDHFTRRRDASLAGEKRARQRG